METLRCAPAPQRGRSTADAAAYEAALKADTSVPKKFSGGLAFMFETSALLKLTAHAVNSEAVQPKYAACWQALPRARVPSAESDASPE